MGIEQLTVQRPYQDNRSVSVAPGDQGTVITVPQTTTFPYDVWLYYLGLSIDVTANSSFASFQLKYNGALFPPFDTINNQLAPANQPIKFDVPYFMGRGGLVELVGLMAAGATGNTLMVANLGLILMKPGQIPKLR